MESQICRSTNAATKATVAEGYAHLEPLTLVLPRYGYTRIFQSDSSHPIYLVACFFYPLAVHGLCFTWQDNLGVAITAG